MEDNLSDDSSESETSLMGVPGDKDGLPRQQLKSGKSSKTGKIKRTEIESSDMRKIKSGTSKRQKRTTRATETIIPHNSGLNGQSVLSVDQANPEEKFQLILSQNLKDYSRQRLRALHMSLRHYSNVEARISQKELNQSFQDNNVKLSSRVGQYLIDRFEDNRGVDFEKLYKYLTEAHLKSGRDSVLAMQKRNDLEPQNEMTAEEKDADLIRRLQELLITTKGYFDIDAMREMIQLKDKDKTGKVSKNEIVDICTRLQSPLYGALFKNLIRRCDEEHNDIIRWPEFLNFLEVSQNNARDQCPELCELQQRLKSKTPVMPNPIDELSEQTRSKLVNTLRKKASLCKKEKISESTDGQQRSSLLENGQTSCNGEITNLNQEADAKQNSEAEKDTSDRKRIVANMRRVTNLVKTSSGFLSTVKTFISGHQNVDEYGVHISKQYLGKRKSEPDMVSPSVEDKDKTLVNVNSEAVSSETDVKNETPSTLEKKEKPTSVIPAVHDNHKVADKTIEESGDRQNEEKSEKIPRKETNITFPKQNDLDVDNQILDPPKERLRLDWVYGYRGNDCRSNIHVLITEEILYFISNIVIMYNRQTHKQRHYREHTEDIKCVCIHSNGNTVASGQFFSKYRPHNMAHIRVWRADTLNTLYVMGSGMFQRVVMAISFAKSSDILAAIDNGDVKRLTLWNVSTGGLCAETMVSTEVICDIQFNNKYPDILVTTGKEHLAWWKIYKESRTIQPLSPPDYENFLRAKYIVSLTHTDKGDLITGDSNGTVYVWSDGGNKIKNYIKHAHDGPVFSLFYMKSFLLTGGRDGIINCWHFNKNMEKAGHVQLPKSEGGVRTLQVHRETLLIGTTMNSMLSISMQNKAGTYPLEGVMLDQIPVTQGHFDDVRGLAVISKTEVPGSIITAGTDGILCWFNTHRRDPVCKLVLKGTQFTSVDAISNGKVLALGTKDGHLVILAIDGESSTEILNQKICKDKIISIKFSPDIRTIAAGSHDKNIYIFTLHENEDGSSTWDFIGKCKGHSGPVQAVDWSKDMHENSYYLKSSSALPEQIVWKLSTLGRVMDFNTRSIEWFSETCKVDINKSGLWLTKKTKEGEINCVSVNPAGNLVAVGDQSGNIRLFRYPCIRPETYSHTYKSHSSVHNLAFSEDGNFLLSIGGQDLCILQWEVVQACRI